VGSDGVLERRGRPSLQESLDDLLGRVDLAIVEGFKAADVGAELRIDADSRVATLTSMDGRLVTRGRRDDVERFAEAIVALFELASGGDESLRTLIRRAAAAHGHQCPGVTIGVRMALAASAALAITLPARRHELHVVMETARCAADAVASATGCSPGRRNFAIEERGAMAARFLDVRTGREARVAARDEARHAALTMVPGLPSRHAQAIAYRLMPDAALLEVTSSPSGCGDGELVHARTVAAPALS
jgi:hypothetical protein